MSSVQPQSVLNVIAAQLDDIAFQLCDWPKIADDHDDLSGWQRSAQTSSAAIRAAVDKIEQVVGPVAGLPLVLRARGLALAVTDELGQNPTSLPYRLVDAAAHYTALKQTASELRILTSTGNTGSVAPSNSPKLTRDQWELLAKLNGMPCSLKQQDIAGAMNRDLKTVRRLLSAVIRLGLVEHVGARRGYAISDAGRRFVNEHPAPNLPKQNDGRDQ